MAVVRFSWIINYKIVLSYYRSLNNHFVLVGKNLRLHKTNNQLHNMQPVLQRYVISAKCRSLTQGCQIETKIYY